MGWTNRAVRGITVPGSAGPDDPRVFVGQGDPALAAISQPAGIVFYWADSKAFALSVEKSGTIGQLHLFAAVGGALAAQIVDVSYDTATGDASMSFGVPVTARGGVALGSATTVDATENTTQTITSITYVPSGGASPVDCGKAFRAPPSGSVTVHWAAEQVNSGAAFNLTSFEVRTGSIVGAGTVVQAANDDIILRNDGTTAMRAGVTARVSGLSPGGQYNIRLMHRRNSGTMTVGRRSIVVTPNL